MQILKLKLLNFRNYEKIELDFDPSKNIIIGKNGMGKTNIVEAIYVLALSKSFRAKDEFLINNKADLTRIEGIIKEKNKTNYKIIITNDKKKVKINNKDITRISDYLSRINVILFNVNDLKLVKDSPAIHRKLINIEMSQFNNDYLKILTLYNKVLKQRNTYLKKIKNNSYNEYLSIITDQLIELGMKIYLLRSDFVLKIQDYIKNIYFNITGKENMQLVYKSEFINKSKEELVKLYQNDLKKDLYFGNTTRGIHHDDFEFFLNDNNLKDYGSEGEQKNAVIALKLAEIEMFKNEKKVKPILILDDLFSELDQEKINNILKYINDDIQVFVTTTELNKLEQKLIDNSKIIEISNGNIIERKI